MITRPDDLTDAQVGEAVIYGWGIDLEELSYAPLGFGSHHWTASSSAGRWFVTVDDLDARRLEAAEPLAESMSRLSAALGAARALHDGGLVFIVAPERTSGGDLLASIDERYVVALYPYVAGETYEWGPYETSRQRLAVIDRLVAIHGVTNPATAAPLVDTFAIPRRSRLEAVLAGNTASWGPGPYANMASELLDRNRDAVTAALARYDELVRDVADRPERFVITHGEPHRANTISTPQGTVLIDWDTTLLAPPERDLWMLVDEDPATADRYMARSGVDIDQAALSLSRIRWELCEIALFTDDCRRPHIDSADMQIAWESLNHYLDPQRRI